MDYKSRASFKLSEMNLQYGIIKTDSTVVDLGSTPGGWSQMALKLVKTSTQEKPKVFGMDVLPMEHVKKD